MPDGMLQEGEAEMIKRKRRKKSTIQKEDSLFKCGCGKTYLSYAALYTHTKVKHEGLFPPGTNTGTKKKQGRPKVSELVMKEAN